MNLLAKHRQHARTVDPSVQRVVKFMPANPPERGTILLVDGVRCRVTRCKVAWDGNRWTIRKLRVKPDPQLWGLCSERHG